MMILDSKSENHALGHYIFKAFQWIMRHWPKWFQIVVGMTDSLTVTQSLKIIVLRSLGSDYEKHFQIVLSSLDLDSKEKFQMI